MKIKIIGLATDDNHLVKNWTSGMEYAGLDYAVCGLNEPYIGYKMKAIKFLEYIKQHPEVDIFIVCDVYDVVINKDMVDRISETGFTVESYIEQVYLEYVDPEDNKIVVGAEKACMINCIDFSLYNLKSIPQNEYKFFNSGMLMGNRKSLIDLYNTTINFRDDQIGLGNYRNMHPERILLESKFKLFYNNYMDADMEKLNSCLFLHFPGCRIHIIATRAYNEIAEKYGYSYYEIKMRHIYVPESVWTRFENSVNLISRMVPYNIFNKMKE